MSLLSAQNITKFYGRQDVLKKVDFQISVGERVGLVGTNGSGKTTLQKIILGMENPDEGQIHKAKGLRLGYLPQDVLTLTGDHVLNLVMDTAEETRLVEAELKEVNAELKELSDMDHADEEAFTELSMRQGHLMDLFDQLGGYQLEARAAKILEGLGFKESDFERPVGELSGGWIMRVALARLLLMEPDLLLLDEPTNHLDMDSLLWLENYLRTCPSSLLLISHDRAFLNNVVNRVLEIDRGVIINYPGNYDRYMIEREKRLAGQAAAYANQQEKIKQLEKFIERNRARASGASRAQSRVKTLEKIELVENPVQRSNFSFSFPDPVRPPRTIVELAGLDKAYGDNVVYKNLDFTIHRGDRLAILGPNGTGKSTIMKLLAGVTDYQAGVRNVGPNTHMAYFAQHQLEELTEHLTILDEVSNAAPDQLPGRLRSMLGSFLFKNDDVFKKVAVLSGGERTRLILAKLMLQAPNLLLLDEPSNHLDIPGREMLEQALIKYKGAICMISHDRELINAVANKVAVIENGVVEFYPGNYDDFLSVWEKKINEENKKAELKAANEKSETGTTGESRADREARKRSEAELRQKLHHLKTPLSKEIADLDKKLEKTSAELDEISAELALPETYQDQALFIDLHRRYNELKKENEKYSEAWEKASLKLEEIEAEFSAG